MLARINSIQLKPGSLPTYLRVLQMEILPMLRDQQGFVNASTVCESSENIHMVTIWDSVKNLENYHNGVFQDICHLLAEVNDGITRSTLQLID